MSTDRTVKSSSFIASGEFAVWCVFAVISGLVIGLVPEAAFAQTPQSLANSICDLTTQLNGTVGKGVATVAVAAAGIMALYGRAAWGTVFVVAGGIALVFSAVGVLGLLGVGGATNCAADSTPQFTCNGATPSGNLFAPDTIAKQQGSAAAPAAGSMCVDATGRQFPCEQSCVQTAAGPTGNCGIFARALWIFNNTIGNVMGAMYCGFSNAIKGPLSALLTIFIVVYGLMVMAGTAQFNLKESGILLFKFALVWAFATQAEWGVDIGYNFFINFAEQGAAMVIAAMPPTPGGQTVTISSPDTIFESILNASTGTQSTVSDTPVACTVFLAVMAMFLLMFMPILLIFFMLLVVNYIGNFARCILGYLTALVLISFLFVLAPFFLGFALFRTTMPLFEAWIKHLIAFSLQMIIMFGFMALLAMIPFAAFFKELLGLLHSYSQTFDFGPSPFIVSFPLSFCGVCQYNIINSHMAVVNAVNTFVPATIQCIPHPLNLAGLTTTQQNAMVLNATKTAANLVWPPGSGQKGYILSEDYQYYVLSLLNLIQHSDFVKFVIVQALSLYFISRVCGEFIKKAPELASAIGELPLAAALGGGATPGNVKINFVGLDAIAAAGIGFGNALRKLQINPLRNPKGFVRRLNPVSTAKDWKDALKASIVGERERDADGNLTGQRLSSIGLIPSLLRGAAGKELDEQAKIAKVGRARKDFVAAADRYDALTKPLRDGSMPVASTAEILKAAQAKIRAEKKYEDLKLEAQGQMQHGLLGEKGIKNSSAWYRGLDAMRSPGSQEQIQRGRSIDIEMGNYGRVLDKNESGYYGFMKIPEGVSRGENSPVKKNEWKNEANALATSMRARLASIQDPEQREAIKRQIDSATFSMQTEAQAKLALAALSNIRF